MKPKRAWLVLTLILGLVFVPAVSAQTNSPDPETTSSAELRKAIRERIEETLKDKDTLQNRFFGYIGTVTQVGTATFSMTNIHGEEKTIQVSPGTALLSAGKPINLADLVVGNGITVMGTPQDELVVEARRVLMSDTDFTESRRVNLGTITEIGRQELTLQLRGEDQMVTWPTNRQTVYEELNGETIQTSILEEDQAVLVITDVDSNDKRYIKHLRLLISIGTDEE